MPHREFQHPAQRRILDGIARKAADECAECCGTEPEPGTDQVAAYLDDAQKRYEAFGESDAMPRLLAVVAEVLKLADRWALRPGDADWARTRARDECATQLREVITRELLGDGQ